MRRGGATRAGGRGDGVGGGYPQFPQRSKKGRAREHTRQRHHHVPVVVEVRATAKKAREKKVRALQKAASQTSAAAQV